MYSHPRRAIVIQGVFGLWLSWAIMFALAITAIEVNSASTWGSLSWCLLVFYGVYCTGTGWVNPGWVSNMGDMVPPTRRGWYFGRRNLVTTAASTTTVFVLSIVLQGFQDRDAAIIGFAVVVTVALSLRSISFVLFQFHYIPPIKIDRENRISLRQFLHELRGTNFGYLAMMAMLVNLGQYIGGSYFNVFMLTPVVQGGLGFDYITYIVVGMVQSIVAVIVYPLAGRFADRHGNVRLLWIGAIIVPFLPIIWCFTHTPLEVASTVEIGSGIGWTVFNLAAANFLYDNMPPQKRSSYAGYYALVVGLGQLIGGLAGTGIITFYPAIVSALPFLSAVFPTSSAMFYALFWLSGLFRAVVVAIYLPRIKEVNPAVKPIFSKTVNE
jgi:MFS-type transporter involved in bile tolerance (Atg22 family)